MTVERFPSGQRSGWLLPASGAAPLVVLLCGEMTDEEIENMGAALPGQVHLCGFSPVNWDEDYPPWDLETSGRSFHAGADRLGIFLTEELLPQAEKRCSVTAEYIVGYSLGGLAALYLACRDHSPFVGCGSCSGSTWFPGCTDWLAGQPFPGRVYLSLGGKEKNTRDLMMARVEECTQAVYEQARTRTEAAFVHERGGHFTDVPGRILRAITWLTR